MGRCSTCGRELNVPANDVVSRDCGGDCLLCMAEAGDFDCFMSLVEVMTKLTNTQRDRLSGRSFEGSSDNHGS